MDFEIHSLKRYDLTAEIVVNSWIRCKTGRRTDPDRTYPAVVVEQDINTLAELLAISNINSETRSLFFKTVPNEMDSILSQYFPG